MSICLLLHLEQKEEEFNSYKIYFYFDYQKNANCCQVYVNCISFGGFSFSIYNGLASILFVLLGGGSYRSTGSILRRTRISPAGEVRARSPPCQAKANGARPNDSKICRMCFLTSFVESALFLSAALHNHQHAPSI